MRLSNFQQPRLSGLSVVPATVSGVLNVGGENVPYKNGVMNYGGQVYAVSDDRDFVISAKNVPIGAIINGALIGIDKLTPTQSAYFQKKYGYTL
jgi:hypothetical protein